jgi:hypothetical protein
MNTKQKDAFARIVVAISKEMTNTGMVPMVIVFGIPGTDVTNPMKVITAFDESFPEAIETAKIRAIQTIQESL